MLSTDPFYLTLSEEQKKFLSEAIERMGWKEYQEGFWNCGRSSIPNEYGECLFYKDNYSTDRLYYQLQVNKEIPTDEEILNDIRNKRLKEIL